jgi:hypothetical protein
MGIIKPKTVSDLMDIANKFADGKDACNNKRTRSPEDDRGNRYGGKRRRSRNYDNYDSHSQVAAGYKDSNYQGDDCRYRSYAREDFSNSKRFQSREPQEYNPSPDDMLNEPCHIHSAFIDGKRVSRHAMKDCKTFLKLQEAGRRESTNKPKQRGKVMTETQTTHLQQLNRQTMELRTVKTSQAKETIMMEDISHPKDTSQQ